MSAQIFVISGPSGVGKSTIIDILRKEMPDLAYSVSHTSRPKREGEIDGVHYNFITRKRFREMIERGEFVEWAEVYGEFYGTSHKSIRENLKEHKDVILDIDPVGARNIKNSYRNCSLIFIVPPSMEELEKRIRKRGTEEEDELKKRLQNAIDEIKESSWYDFIVINENVKDAVMSLKSIIISSRLKSIYMFERVKELLMI